MKPVMKKLRASNKYDKKRNHRNENTMTMLITLTLN